ncbi:LOW QUALITY PROTEIN: serine hydrolase-like protein [Pogonomyrmex barbatus]|uniref:LOW QUALITY PROTEIN: serine hydrolase-like protein n=1 Tax=Pogonomyrmex barbatus TaxID=144034 RepID=A0A6I9WIG7_9HYME|nr:LOW QUALITY PROTEIN: serine hydrolase-like protein [Pogonomyrmex barbatus]
MVEADPPFTDIKLEVPWGHIAAKTYGSPSGKPVLLAHGREDNAGTFTRLMKYLPMDLFYYVCVDLPGHGWSSHFPSWMIIDAIDYCYTLYFIFEALQWKSCIYIGHSLGAQIGLIFSIFQPNRIEKLITIDGILINPYIKHDEIAQYFKKASVLSNKIIRNEKAATYTKEEILHIYKTTRFLNSEAAMALFERGVTEINGRYKFNRDIRIKIILFHFSLPKYVNNLKMLSVPTYVFISSHGIIAPYKEYPSILEVMKAKVKLEIIEINGNHDVHNNNPERIAPFIQKILSTENSSKL